MSRPVLRGACSANDAADKWKCTKCGSENHSIKGRFFDVPKIFCSCGKKFRGKFKICLKDVEINGHRIVKRAKRQIGPRCVAYAYTHGLEIKKRVKELLKKRNPDLIPELDPDNLWLNLETKFPDHPIDTMNGSQLLVHMGLILKEKGIKAVTGKKYYKTSDVSTIKSNDYQAMFNAIANGDPLVGSIYTGKRLRKLKWCQIYRPPSAERCRQKKKKTIGHAVVFIGGGMTKRSIFLFFLNSWKLFCIRRFVGQKNWHGVGKVRAFGLQKNVMLLSKQDDAGERSLQVQHGPSPQLSTHNAALVRAEPGVIRELDYSESDDDQEVIVRGKLRAQG